MKPNHEYMNIEIAPGIIDVYNGDVTSFTMCNPCAVSVKCRVSGDVVFEHEIPVV